MPDSFERIKTSQGTFSISMDVKNEENKRVATRGSGPEDNIERMENDI